MLRQPALMERKVGLEVFLENLSRSLGVRTRHLHLEVESPGAQNCRINQILAIACPDYDHIFERLYAIDFRKELSNDRRLHIRRNARPSHSEERIHLVEKDDNRNILARLLSRLHEDFTQLALGFAHVFVQQLGALDVQEVRGRSFACPLLHLLRKGVGHCLGDQSLPAAWGTVEQNTFGRPKLMLLEYLRMEIGEFDRIPQDFDLIPKTADVGVGDIRDLLEHDFFHR